MGPRSDERGNVTVPVPQDAPVPAMLQWGRARMSAEMQGDGDGRLFGDKCFNGAALG